MPPSRSSPSTSARRNSNIVLQDLVSSLRRLNLSRDIEIGSVRAVGGYADVYDGMLLITTTNERTKVAVKRFRVVLDGMTGKQFAMSFARELCVWARLDHENILPLIGVTVVHDLPALASPWIDNGTVTTYIKNTPDVEIKTMAEGIAKGLLYLHEKGIVHGDLKSDNVLVSSKGVPMLTDFGISRLLIDSVTIAGPTSCKGSIRWMAPELLYAPESTVQRDHPLQTKATDVWAYGMVVYELLSGELPFHHLRSDVQVIMAISSNQLPPKPTPNESRSRHLDFIWDVCVSCRAKDLQERPNMLTIVDIFGQHSSSLTITRHFTSGLSDILCLTFSPDGEWLAVGNDCSIGIWNVSTVAMIFPSLQGVDGNVMAWSRLGDFIITASLHVWTLQKRNAVTGSIVSTSGERHHEIVTSIAYSPDGKRILSGDREGTIIIWDASNWSALSVKSQHTSFRSLRFSPDGQDILSHHLEQLSFWDVNTGEAVGELVGSYQSIAFHPDRNEFLAIPTWGDSIVIWNARAGTYQKTIPAHPVLPMLLVQYSGDGRHIIQLCESLTTPGLVYATRDVTTGHLIKERRAIADWKLHPYGKAERRCTLTLDGRVAATSHGKEITIWDFSDCTA